MPRRNLLVIKRPPYGSLMAAEGSRIATAMVAMDVLPQLLFMEDGVYCLLEKQRPEAAGLSSFYEQLKTLADLVGLCVLKDSMIKRGLKITDLDESLHVKLLVMDEAAKLMMESETVIAF